MALKLIYCVTVLIGGLLSYDVTANPAIAEPRFREIDLKLFEGLRKRQPGVHNLVFSPLSVRTVLAMLKDGAGGRTRSDLASVLGDTNRPTSLLYPREEDDGLSVANAVFLSSRLKVNPKYQNHLFSRYKALLDYSDFSRPRSAADKINEWVMRSTKGHIEQLIDRDSLPSETVLLLANAVHLHGKWSHPFPEGNTKLDTFYEGFCATNTSTLRVPTMSQYNYFKAGFVNSLNAKVLEMPFQEPEGLSMLFLLPNERGGLVDMLERLVPSSLSAISNSLGESNLVSVRIPLFSAFTTQRINSILPPEAANVFGSEADLSGITQNSEQVVVSQALHKAGLSVDEKGATGSAVSAVTAILLHSGAPFQFHCSHPFAYMVIDKRDAEAGHIEPVFMGYVTSIEGAEREQEQEEQPAVPLSADRVQQPITTTTQNPNRIHFTDNNRQTIRQSYNNFG